MQPSESTRSKVTRVAAAQRRVAASPASATASVVSTHQHGGQPRGEHAGALGHAADGEAVARRDGRFGTVSVVMIASRRRAAVAGQPAGRRADAGQQLVHRQPLTDQPGRAHRDLAGADRTASRRVSTAAVCSAVAWVSWKPSGPVQALAPPELSTTARTAPSRTTCRRPEHRRGLDPVGGEDARRGRRPARR